VGIVKKEDVKKIINRFMKKPIVAKLSCEKCGWAKYRFQDQSMEAYIEVVELLYNHIKSQHIMDFPKNLKARAFEIISKNHSIKHHYQLLSPQFGNDYRKAVPSTYDGWLDALIVAAYDEGLKGEGSKSYLRGRWL